MFVVIAVLAALAAVVLLDVRRRKETAAVLRGLRQDLDHLARQVVERGAEGRQLEQYVCGPVMQAIMNAHGMGAQSLDRLMYYTRISKPLGRLGQAYDRALAKAKAKVAGEREAIESAKTAAPQEAASAPTPELADVDTGVKQDARDTGDETTDDDMSQIAGSIGPAATAVGE